MVMVMVLMMMVMELKMKQKAVTAGSFPAAVALTADYTELEYQVSGAVMCEVRPTE